MSLKLLTEDKHKEAENTKFIQKIFSGEIRESNYYLYLCQLAPIYEVLERKAKEFGLFDDLQGIERYEKINLDKAEFAGNYMMMPVLPETIEYVEYLETLNAGDLLAHIYVRHMGDMFGGQQLAKLVPGSAKMYEFDVDTLDLITNLRAKLNDEMHIEANKAYQYNIDILRTFDDVVEPNVGVL